MTAPKLKPDATRLEDNIVCPWCGEEDPDSFEWPDSSEGGCTSCGQRIAVERDVSVTYSTRPVGYEEVDGLEWKRVGPRSDS